MGTEDFEQRNMLSPLRLLGYNDANIGRGEPWHSEEVAEDSPQGD